VAGTGGTQPVGDEREIQGSPGGAGREERTDMGVDRVVMFSGGLGSEAAARRVADQFGTKRLTLLFTDTRGEDNDLYRFLVISAVRIFGINNPTRRTALGGAWEVLLALPEREPGEKAAEWAARRKPLLAKLQRWTAKAVPRLKWIAEGRTIWEVFEDERYLGNSRADPCSKILKRQMADRWLDANRDPASTVVYVGIDWSEIHRYEHLRDRRLPWTYEAPLCSAPYLTKQAMLQSLRDRGIEPPRLYALGFHHNNCGGGCVKAGIGHFAHLLRVLPAVYAEWEENEEALRQQLGRNDIAILRSRAGGTPTPLTLAALRQRIEAGGEVDQFEIGGCGCFSDVEEAATAEIRRSP
jgi:hypothetical protein